MRGRRARDAAGRHAVAYGAIVSALAGAGNAAAQARPPEPGRSAQSVATEAAKLEAKGDLAAACAKYADADHLDPKLSTIEAVAKCERRAGRTASSQTAYAELEKRALATKNALAARAARREIDALDKVVPKVTITVGASPPAALEIKLDGRPLDRGVWGTAVAVDPGTHHVEASASGYEPFSVDVAAAPSTVGAATIPPLVRAVRARFVSAEAPPASALSMVGDARWEEGLGLVRASSEGEAPLVSPEPAFADRPPAVPELRKLRLDGFSFVLLGGVTTYSSGLAQNGPITGSFTTGEAALALGYTFRQMQSLFVPWVSIEGAVGSPFDSAGVTTIVRAEGRAGLELHPARLRWIGIGPLAGYEMSLYNVKNADGVTQGAFELGGSAHFRTLESTGSPPAFDAELSLRQAFAGEVGATYGGATLGMGGATRFVVYADYRLTQTGQLTTPGQTADAFSQSLPAELRAGIGLRIQ